MTQKGDQSLDTRLLCDIVIEMNISRRNVSIYPKGHSSVTKSLDKAFGLLQNLFDLRDRVDLSVARDTLIVDDFYFDKKNAVYREYATSLSGLNIACVRFHKDLTKDELYSLHRLLSVARRPLDAGNCALVRKEFGLVNIELIPVDYDVFTFEDGRAVKGGEGKDLWARYVRGLLDGTLQAANSREGFNRVPPERLAELLNLHPDRVGEESYDAVITSYLRKKSEQRLSGEDLKRLMSVINNLDPELKKQFLSSSIKNLSRNIGGAERAMRSVSVEKMAQFLSLIEEQKLFVPRSLKSLIGRFSELHHDGLKSLGEGQGVIADDFLLSPEIMDLLNEKRYEEHIPQSYQDEMQKIMNCDVAELYTKDAVEFRRKWSDEWAESSFNKLLLELLSVPIPPTVSGESKDHFVGSLKEQIEMFASIGQYDRILETMKFLGSATLPGEASGTIADVLNYCGSRDFMSLLAESFRAVGRQKRDEAAMLCSYYGALIAPTLLDALAAEETQAGRRFLIGLVTHLGAPAVNEVRERLKDERWYIKRNALFIIGECGGEEALKVTRPYCMHNDPRVRLEAIRNLVRWGDEEGIGLLRGDILSGDRERALAAISLAGSLAVRQLVPELAGTLSPQGLSLRGHELRTEAVRALGKITGRESEEVLLNVLSAKRIFFRKDQEKLKDEARKALGKVRRGGGGPKRDVGHED